MFGFVSKRKATAIASAAVEISLEQAKAGVVEACEEVGAKWRAEVEALTARAEAAEARCKALERRLDGWVPADQASSMRWRIAELECQVVEIRAAASLLKSDRDYWRERLSQIARDDDAQAVALFRPGQPVGFEPVGEPIESAAHENPVGSRVVG